MVDLTHNWQHRVTKHGVLYVLLDGNASMSVRCKPCPMGSGYMWQFRKTVSYAPTIEQAINYVEAGKEFFDVMRRNPYS